mgnify:CR=1 FL=1
MNALVTGGSGYFGSLLIRKLLEMNFNVGSLDINTTDLKNKNLTFHNCDIRDRENLINQTKNYDVVFHNVAQVPIAKNSKLFWEVNVEGTKNLCRACIENNIQKLVYTSSSAVYGVPKLNPVNEASKPVPGESYGKAKLEGEKICKDFSKMGLKVTIIRPRTILGHGRLGIFSVLFDWIKEGVNIPVLNNGSNIYQFVHATDLADACILASKNNDQYSAYNIGSEDFGTMRQALENLCEYANTGSKIYSLPRLPVELSIHFLSKLNLIPLAPYHALMYGRSLYFDISRAKKEIGYSPKFSTREMFQESYDWYLKNYSVLKNLKNKSAHNKPVNEALLKLLRIFR